MSGGNVGYDPSYGPGWLPYVNTEGQEATYSVFLSQVALVAGAFLVLTPPTNDRTAKITRVVVGPSVATAVGKQAIQLVSWSTLATGGTQGTAPVVNKHDGNDPASTLAPAYYTAAPVAGTLASTFRSEQLFSQAVATLVPAGNQLVWDFGNRPSKCPILRPTQGGANTNQFALTASAALAGQLADLYVEWTERAA